MTSLSFSKNGNWTHPSQDLLRSRAYSETPHSSLHFALGMREGKKLIRAGERRKGGCRVSGNRHRIRAGDRGLPKPREENKACFFQKRLEADLCRIRVCCLQSGTNSWDTSLLPSGVWVPGQAPGRPSDGGGVPAAPLGVAVACGQVPVPLWVCFTVGWWLPVPCGWMCQHRKAPGPLQAGACISLGNVCIFPRSGAHVPVLESKNSWHFLLARGDSQEVSGSKGGWSSVPGDR